MLAPPLSHRGHTCDRWPGAGAVVGIRPAHGRQRRIVLQLVGGDVRVDRLVPDVLEIRLRALPVVGKDIAC
jgi:hypothetical protein